MIVFKFNLFSTTTLDIPGGAEILSVQNQRGLVQMWVLCNPDQPTEVRTFQVLPTGVWFQAPSARYLGTVQLQEGELVLHAFETTPTKEKQS